MYIYTHPWPQGVLSNAFGEYVRAVVVANEYINKYIQIYVHIYVHYIHIRGSHPGLG